MSNYELDDEVVATFVCNYRHRFHKESANATEPMLAELLGKQMPAPEPDHEYLVKDKDGDIWRWDARQITWACASSNMGYVTWPTLVARYSPLTIYGPIS